MAHFPWRPIPACAALVAAGFVCLGSFLGWLEYSARATEHESWRRLMDPAAADPGLTPPAIEPTDDATRVTVGIYLERIARFEIPESSWTAVLDIWFEWEGDRFDPAERLVAVDGSIEDLDLLREHHEGARHFVCYSAEIQFTRAFCVTRFPLDDHLLLVGFENAEFDRRQLLFVPDAVNSVSSSRVAVPGYRVTSLRAIEKPHSYKNNRGVPNAEPGRPTTFSQARFGLELRRDGWGLFLKMFQALFVAVAIAILPFFIRPTDLDPRFGLGVGALFAAVANAYLIISYVPNTVEFTLADMVNLVGIVTILITLVESTVSLWMWQAWNRQDLSRQLDRMLFLAVLIGYVAANAAILFGAVG
jgi:hypothetical protein